MNTRQPGRARVGTVSVMLLIVSASCSSGEARRDDTLGPVDDADATNVPDVSSGPPGSSLFYCGEFGSERPPTLLAIDVATGTPAWKTCTESAIPLFIAGRADGATVLLEQDGRGGAELIAVDDTGVERWRRPTRLDSATGNEFLVAGPTAVVTTDRVEGITAATGVVAWTHPVADGTPVGATGDVVIEMSGGPFALSTDVSARAGSGSATMRGVDSTTGEARWTRSVDLASAPIPGAFSVTVGGQVILLRAADGSTTIVEAATGVDLRSESGLVEVNGGAMYEREMATLGIAALIDPVSGARTDPPPGSPVFTAMSRGQGPGGLLLASEPPTGPAATLTFVDTASGAVRWEIPYVPVIGSSDRYVVTANGPSLQILDMIDGSVMTEYRAPTDLATFTSAVAGDGIVIATAQWRGSPAGTGGPGEEAFVPPTCDGGPSMLDTSVDGTRLRIEESVDATVFCVDDGSTTAIGYVPTTPTPDPREDSTMISARNAFHVVRLPAGFPDVTRAVGPDGLELSVARGVANDYLIVIEPVEGGPVDGMIQQGPMPGGRTVDFFGADGSIVARVRISDLATPDSTSNQGVSDGEDFLTCARDHGVDIPLAQPGEGPRYAEPASAEVLDDAWTSCRDLFASTMTGTGTTEFVEDRLWQLDCLADAGFYPNLAQEVTDPAASNNAIDSCAESSPGRLAVVECLTTNGLAVVVDGAVSGGPHEPELTATAWANCRDVYIAAFVPTPMLVDERLDPLDCAAEKGWILAVMDLRERFAEAVVTDVASCYE